jgi:hypothetical protein
MRSRAARWTFGTVTWIALGAAVFFVFKSEQQIASLTSSLHAFDLHAGDAIDALGNLRAAQQAYVSAGQGVAFWMPKVASTTDALTTALTALYQTKVGAGTRTALDEAGATVAEFADTDRRAREYVASGQQLMAADVIFTEGGNAAESAARQVEAARRVEREAYDANSAAIRQQEALAIGGAAALAGLVVLFLAPLGSEVDRPQEQASMSIIGQPLDISSAGPARLVQPAQIAPTPAPTPAAKRSAPVLKAMADLATEFGRVRDSEELTRLLGRTADMMDASGLVVWVGNSAGADLRPALAHGYAPAVLARMPSVPRSGDNAAAAAYRTGSMQIVLSRPGGASGAIVAPILAAEGCVGALSAEIKGGGETSEAIQALSSLVASHLAGVLAATPVEAEQAKAANS